MKLSIDRTLKLLWLAIGVLLLLFLVAIGVTMVGEAVGSRRARSEAVRVVREGRAAGDEPRAVRYGPPQGIRGTDTRIAFVDYGSGYSTTSSGGYFSDRRATGTDVNVMFIDAQGVRLLFDRPALIREISYPRVDPGGSAAALEQVERREWISYVLALDDTNRNGRLDDRDAVALYVTDLDGRNLRPVVSPPLRYQDHVAVGATQLLVYALEAPPGQNVGESRMRQRAFIYDVRVGRLSPYAALDSAAEQAGRILRR